MKVARPLLKRAGRRLEALAARRPLVLAMDFDGTLAPIVRQPSRARMPAGVRRLLKSLKGKGLTIALLSGRSLWDLRQKSGLKGVLLSGSHGLTSNVRGVGLAPAKARLWKARMARAKKLLGALALPGLGIRVEDKELGLALHLRGATKAVRAGLHARVAGALGGLPLELKAGLELLEVLPRAGWDKGRALLKIADLRAPGWRSKGACIFAGDDATDEDAFRVLRPLKQGLGLKIGSGKTLASQRLKRPADFWGLLKKINSLRTE